MQITHQEARALIQYERDRALGGQSREALAAHLRVCAECRLYAEEIHLVETILGTLLHQAWDVHPTPLPVGPLVGRRSAKIHRGAFLAMRMLVMSLLFATLVFSAWQFSLPVPAEPAHMPVNVLAAPTPSALSTSTQILFEDCRFVHYRVREQDTLAEIAAQFSVSEEAIAALNRLGTQGLPVSTELRIPLCSLTPTGTVDPAVFETTYTPAHSPAASTPGG